MNSPPAPWKCPRRVGYLFPHECTRMTPLDCPDCQSGQAYGDPYSTRRDRPGYSSNYDEYGSDWTGETIGASDDFTEGDGVNLVKPRRNFEDDMSAS